LKIFVSYSRRDADFAKQVDEYFEESEHVIFTDVNNIQIGDIWSDVIKDNISKCDVFAIIVTFASIRSKDVEKEVLQAKEENKIIIPCTHKDVGIENLKWDLGRYQGFEFDDRYDLARKLYRNINKYETLAKKRETFHNHLIDTTSNKEKKTPKEQNNEVRDMRSDDGKDVSSYRELLVQGKVEEFNKLREMENYDLIHLEKIILKGAKLPNINLSNADLSNADLSNALLNNANLSRTNFNNSSLYGAELVNADLKDAILEGAMIEAARFLNAKNLPISMNEIKSRGGTFWF
jgi:TIR domain-containing protein/pentapeptide repeat protein